MKLFKNLFLFSMVITAVAGTSYAMEKPVINYSDPIEMYNSSEDYTISAKMGNTEIGSISYILKQKKAKMLFFEVNKEFRNNKAERVGQQLFQKCVNHVIAQGYKQLEWTAQRTPTSNFDISTICTIYEKLVQKLENAQSYTFTKGRVYEPHNPKVDMKLIFKKV